MGVGVMCERVGVAAASDPVTEHSRGAGRSR